jgi:3-oxoacid CoA-transferase subunit A
MNKVYSSPELALSDIVRDGMVIMMGGFGPCGLPEHLIRALINLNVKDITIICNDCGSDDFSVGLLLKNNQIKKVISSYVGDNKIFEQQYLSGKLEVELTPQGTLAEKIRAGGAGIPAFYTKTGVGTIVAEGKEVREFDGEQYIMERSLFADLSIIKGWKGDKIGNIIYNKTTQNFNPLMAKAAKITVCEVEEIVETGTLDPNHIQTQSVFVKRLVLGDSYEKKIQYLTTRTRG